MATSISTIEYILDQLSDIENIDYKKMFGNYALYKNKKTISLICNNNMYLKNFQEIRDFVKSSGYNYKEGYPFPGAKVWIEIDYDLIENRNVFQELISLSEEVYFNK